MLGEEFSAFVRSCLEKPAYIAMESAHIVGAKGLRIFVRSWRPEGKAHGVVAICHGVNSHSGYYTWAAAQLVASGLAVYALDLHGRGKSDGERFYLDAIGDYVADVDATVMLAKSREPGLPVFLLGHSAGGVVSCVYTLENQAKLAGLICESFAFQVAAPDFALSLLKGLSAIAPHLRMLPLKKFPPVTSRPSGVRSRLYCRILVPPAPRAGASCSH